MKRAKGMKNYCRYCINAVAQSEDYAFCSANRMMVRKHAVGGTCKDYGFCEIDAFYAFRGLEPDDPRAKYKPKEPVQKDGDQMTWDDVLEGE